MPIAANNSLQSVEMPRQDRTVPFLPSPWLSLLVESRGRYGSVVDIDVETESGSELCSSPSEVLSSSLMAPRPIVATRQFWLV